VPNNINLYFITNKEQIVFGYILFDLVLFDIRYWQQVSDKYGQYTGNANWKCKGRDRRED
jgi:hypothetical protein